MLLAFVLFLFSVIASAILDSLSVDYIPQRPKSFDSVTIRCQIKNHRKNCQFNWNWASLEIDQENHGLLPLPTYDTPFWQIVKTDNPEMSVILIKEMTEEQQGLFTCRLVCSDGLSQIATVTVEMDETVAGRISSKNAQIAYIICGVLFSFVFLLTCLRFICSNSTECCPSEEKQTKDLTSNIRFRFPSSFSINSTTRQTLNSLAFVPWRQKPVLQPRPTILSETVWLPPYEVAVRQNEFTMERPSCSTSSQNTYNDLNTSRL